MIRSPNSPVTLTGVYGSWVAWGDYDNDGDLDILLAGTTGSNQALTQIWRNDDCPPDLSIAKAVTPTTVLPGQPITYTLAFSYTGPGLATGVLIADQLPAFIATTSVASSGVVLTPTGSASYAWQVQDLTSGQGGVITLTGIVSPGLQGLTGFSNTATITGTTTELNTANNSSSANVTLHYALDIRTIGGGAVTRNPNQIDYAYGEVITLTANPTTGWAFSGWSGDLNGILNPATFTLSGSQTITATFNTTCLPITAADFFFAPTTPKIGQPVNLTPVITQWYTAHHVYLEFWRWRQHDHYDSERPTQLPVDQHTADLCGGADSGKYVQQSVSPKSLAVLPHGIYLPLVLKAP